MMSLLLQLSNINTYKIHHSNMYTYKRKIQPFNGEEVSLNVGIYYWLDQSNDIVCLPTRCMYQSRQS